MHHRLCTLDSVPACPADGSEITPATYLFTTYTNYKYIRTSPDSLGRLHVLYNIGKDVIYAVWTPVPGSGFITEYEWKVEGASAGGVLLVEGCYTVMLSTELDRVCSRFVKVD